jgi:hypothetical protein
VITLNSQESTIPSTTLLCHDFLSFNEATRLRSPEILYTIGGTQDPQSLREAKQEAKEELEPELENEDDKEAQAEIRETIHRLWVTGIIWVQDEYTAEFGKVLLAWLDEFGRSMRCTRIEYENVSEWTGMFELLAGLKKILLWNIEMRK